MTWLAIEGIIVLALVKWAHMPWWAAALMFVSLQVYTVCVRFFAYMLTWTNAMSEAEAKAMEALAERAQGGGE